MRKALLIFVSLLSFEASAGSCRFLFEADLAYPSLAPEFKAKTFSIVGDRIVQSQMILPKDENRVRQIISALVSFAFRTNKPGQNVAGAVAEAADRNGQSLLVVRDEIIHKATEKALEILHASHIERGKKFLDVDYVIGRPIKVQGWAGKLKDGSLLCTFENLPEGFSFPGVQLLPVAGRLIVNPESVLDVKESLNPILEITRRVLERIIGKPLSHDWKVSEINKAATQSYCTFLNEMEDECEPVRDLADHLTRASFARYGAHKAEYVTSIADLKSAFLSNPQLNALSDQERQTLVDVLDAHLVDPFRKSLEFQRDTPTGNPLISSGYLVILPDGRKVMLSLNIPVLYSVALNGDLNLALDFNWLKSNGGVEFRVAPLIQQSTDALQESELMKMLDSIIETVREYHMEKNNKL